MSTIRTAQFDTPMVNWTTFANECQCNCDNCPHFACNDLQFDCQPCCYNNGEMQVGSIMAYYLERFQRIPKGTATKNCKLLLGSEELRYGYPCPILVDKLISSKRKDIKQNIIRLVSTIQAAFSFFVGLIVCKATCSRSFVYASHFLMEAYGWFGTAYFMYDLWAMYKVHTQQIADKLKLVGALKQTSNGKAKNGKTNELYDKKKNKTNDEQNDTNDDRTNLVLKNDEDKQHPTEVQLKQLERKNSDYDEEYVDIPKGERLTFFKYLIRNPLMMVHHIFIGTFGLLVVTYIRGGGHCIYSYMYMMEFSTPFVSLRSVLSTLGLKKSRAYVINGILMLVTFFICRIYMWPHVMWHYSAAINKTMWQAFIGLPRGCLIAISILLFPQLYWFYLMVKGAAKVLIPGKSNKAPANAQANQAKNNSTSPKNDVNGHSTLCSAKQNGQVSLNDVIGEKVIEKVVEGISPLLDVNGKL